MARAYRPSPEILEIEAQRTAKIWELAAQIRKLFWDHYNTAFYALTGVPGRTGNCWNPSWDGDVAKTTERATTSVWWKAALVCLKQELAPEELVQACFTPLRPPLPWPTALLHKKLHERLADFRLELDERFTLLLAEMKSIYASEIRALLRTGRYDQEAASREALTRTMPGVSALFRYCVAVRAKDEAVAAHFHATALHLYLCSRGVYDRTWGELIPVTLQQEARKLAGGKHETQD